MKNSDETLKRIEEIKGLDYEITSQIVEEDLKRAENNSDMRKFLDDLLKQYNVKVSEEEEKKKFIEIYMDCPPYIGYCHIYWDIKKKILNEKYNINWYTPQEENPMANYD